MEMKEKVPDHYARSLTHVQQMHVHFTTTCGKRSKNGNGRYFMFRRSNSENSFIKLLNESSSFYKISKQSSPKNKNAGSQMYIKKEKKISCKFVHSAFPVGWPYIDVHLSLIATIGNLSGSYCCQLNCLKIASQ